MRYYFTVSENNLICISVPAAMHAYFRTALRLRSFVALGGKRQDMNSINKLTLCIPMYNESSIIADTVKTLTAALEQYREGGAYRCWELIVSDDGSTDGSADIVRSLGQSGVRICGYEHNRGKGCAVRTAMLEASREDGSSEHVIMFTDADLAYGTEVIDRFARAFAQHRDTDIFIGSISAATATRAIPLSGALRQRRIYDFCVSSEASSSPIRSAAARHFAHRRRSRYSHVWRRMALPLILRRCCLRAGSEAESARYRCRSSTIANQRYDSGATFSKWRTISLR